MVSLPAKVTVTAALYQPFAFGCRSGVAVVAGAVASYLSVSDARPPFPALSKQVPLTLVVVASGPEYEVSAGQDWSPDVASVAAKLTVSEWLYQPFLSAGLDGVAVACGAVASYLSP